LIVGAGPVGLFLANALAEVCAGTWWKSAHLNRNIRKRSPSFLEPSRSSTWREWSLLSSKRQTVSLLRPS
jgi:2-polyprenyl-6-methoxyphenol hydroxylase-like FAD-dependent oxidoreductase